MEAEMTSSVRHIALVVPNLREAEEYYQSIFQMELIGRETDLGDGQWYTLPVGKGWEDAEAAGIELKMLALRKGDVVLALFSGPHPSGQVFAIGLAMPQAQVAEVRNQLPPDAEVIVDQKEQFKEGAVQLPRSIWNNLAACTPRRPVPYERGFRWPVDRIVKTAICATCSLRMRLPPNNSLERTGDLATVASQRGDWGFEQSS
jgi:catechol 2,3-dioxygenase-like lactoylglutathione lyase family enzyme